MALSGDGDRASCDGTQSARHDAHSLGLDSCKLIVGLQEKALALMALGHHVHCTARRACCMREQHTFRFRP